MEGCVKQQQPIISDVRQHLVRGGMEGCVEGCGECGGTCGRAGAGGGLWGGAKVRQRKGELHTGAGHPVQAASSESPTGM